MLANAIQETILEVLPDATVFVNDPDGQHFDAIVISPSFVGMPLVKQHQLVMNALKEAFEGPVHALALKTYTPEKWAAAQS
ncbi:MAG: BolA family protein [Candidatus Margulisiibacteriota bacterium]